MTELVDRNQAAKLAGVSVHAVDKAAKEGKLRKAARGMYAVDDVKAWRAGAIDGTALLNMATHTARAAAATKQATHKAADAVADEAGATLAGDHDMPPTVQGRGVDGQLSEAGSILLRAKTQSEVFKARERELAFKKLQGSLVERELVKRQGAEISRVLVSRLRALPMRLGPMLAPVTDESECIKLIETEIRDMIMELQEAVAAV